MPAATPPASSIVGWVSATEEITVDVRDIDEICIHTVSDNFQGMVSFGMYVQDGSTNIPSPCRMFGMDPGQFVDRSNGDGIFYLKIPPSMLSLSLYVTRNAGRIDLRKYTRSRVVPPPPTPLCNLTLTYPLPLPAGTSIQGVVFRDGPTDHDLTVNIESNDPDHAAVSGPVTILAGAISGTFTISSPWSSIQGPYSLTASAPGYNSVTKSDGYVTNTVIPFSTAPVSGPFLEGGLCLESGWIEDANSVRTYDVEVGKKEFFLRVATENFDGLLSFSWDAALTSSNIAALTDVATGTQQASRTFTPAVGGNDFTSVWFRFALPPLTKKVRVQVAKNSGKVALETWTF